MTGNPPGGSDRCHRAQDILVEHLGRLESGQELDNDEGSAMSMVGRRSSTRDRCSTRQSRCSGMIALVRLLTPAPEFEYTSLGDSRNRPGVRLGAGPVGMYAAVP